MSSQPTKPPTARTKNNGVKLREFCLSLPETREDFPWGHSAFKVKDKAFCFMVEDGNDLRMSLKLPESGTLVLGMDNTEPTGYGLGKSGWVSMSALPTKDLSVKFLQVLLEESYRAVAPKRVSALLDDEAPSKKPGKKTAKKKTAKKKTAKKKTAKKKTAKK